MSLFCKGKHPLSVLQRRFLGLFGVTFILTASLTLVVRDVFKHYHPTGTLAYLLAVLPALPFIGTLILGGVYLAKETDEFVRMLVQRALLWGFAVTMVVGTVWGFLGEYCQVQAAPQMMYVDLFVVFAGLALGVMRTRYQ